MGEEYGGEEQDGGDDTDGEEGSGVRDIEEHVEEVMRHLPDNGDVIGSVTRQKRGKFMNFCKRAVIAQNGIVVHAQGSSLMNIFEN